MKTKQMFDVIICCYNSERTIENAIEAIENQKQIANLVRKIIVVNNNSTDSTCEIVMKELQKYKNIELINEYQLGLSNARRAGVIVAKSPWIIFVDDDNYLKDDWIFEASEYIKKNNNIGIFNGAVVPLINWELDNDTHDLLQSSLKVLACTHVKKEEIEQKPYSPYRTAIGAGMVVNTKLMKDLNEQGWLKARGRTGEDLSSGEDTEISEYVTMAGYKVGFNSKMLLHHAIHPERLKYDYLTRLWYSIGAGVGINLKKNSKFKVCLYDMLIHIRLLKKYFSKNKYDYIFYKEYIKGVHDELSI